MVTNVTGLTCNFEQPGMERKQELQTAINLQTMDNPSENQAATHLPVNKQNTCGLLLGRVQNTPKEFEIKRNNNWSVYI